MNPNFRAEKAKTDYQGLYVTNLDDFESDIFALHQSETESKTAKPVNSRPDARKFQTRTGPNHTQNLPTSTSSSNYSKSVPTLSPTSGADAVKDIVTTASGTTNSASKTPKPTVINASVKSPGSNAKTQSAVTATSGNHRGLVPSTQIAKRQHVTPRKMDVKGYGHDTEDMVIQNLDEDFY